MSDVERFVSLLPEDGRGISNRRLRDELGWAESKYETVKASLLAKRRVVKGPGAGGSVRRADASADDDEFLEVLEGLGGRASNPQVRKQLGWDKAKYFEVRDRLFDEGWVEKGQGRGGVVKLVEEDDVDDAAEEHESTSVAEIGVQRGRTAKPDAVAAAATVSTTGRDAVYAWAPEDRLYEPTAGVLKREWAEEKSFRWSAVEVTAKQGRRATGGRWTRPDITVVSLTRYSFVPGQHLEVWTFEVKTAETIDITAVYEAVSHSKFATRSYVVFPFPDEDEQTEEEAERFEAVLNEALRHGVGVITMTEPGDFDTWYEHAEPEHSDPELQRVNDFIATQLSVDTKSDLRDELRGA